LFWWTGQLLNYLAFSSNIVSQSSGNVWSFTPVLYTWHWHPLEQATAALMMCVQIRQNLFYM